LPALVSDDAEQPAWLTQICERLTDAAFVDRAETNSTIPPKKRNQVQVASVRETALIGRVRDRLAAVGIELAEKPMRGALVVADLSGLEAAACRRVVQTLHAQHLRSLPVWRSGTETFFGPWTKPGHTACWNCCVSRAGLNPRGDSVEPDEITTRALFENLLLASRYPDLLPTGCLVTDQGESGLHSVLPMPHCDVCGGAAALQTLHTVPLKQSTVVPRELRMLADPRGSVIKHVFVFDGRARDAPGLPIAASAHVGPYRHGAQWREDLTGEGKGATRAGAVRSAIGEALERYSASLWDPAQLTRASFRQLGAEGFDPRWLVLYDYAQYSRPDFAFAPFDDDLTLDWVAGNWLDTRESVYLPALATFMHFEAEAEERFAQVTSNGLAAHSTPEQATLAALYELIERDAFGLYWLAKTPAQRIDPSGCDRVTRRALREVERFGARCELYILDVGTKHPTIACLGLGDGENWPGATIGLCAHATVDIALQHAVLEHGHAGTYFRRLMLEKRHRAIHTADQVITALDHALYYIPPNRVEALDDFRSGTESITLAELRSRYRLEANVDVCVAALGDIGIRTAAVDVTSPDVALTPIRVVRAFGVYMQPINFGAANRRMGNPRLASLLIGPAASEPHPIA
jgi:ribosomal protein S12 methylthiotransferase accessory factor